MKAPYFSKMFNGEFAEAQSQAAKLPEDDPKIFKFFLRWIYQGILEVSDLEQSTRTGNHVHLFIFAEKYCIDSLADTVMDSFVNGLRARNSIPLYPFMTRMCKHTHGSSKLNLFFARIIAYTFYHDKDSKKWKTEHLRDVLKANDELTLRFLELLRPLHGKEYPDPTKAPLCDYHQHGKDEPCPYIKKE